MTGCRPTMQRSCQKTKTPQLMEELQRLGPAPEGKLVLDRVAHAYNPSTWKIWQKDCHEFKIRLGNRLRHISKRGEGDYLKSNQVSTAAATPGYSATMKKPL